ncbi:MAG: hypothetical protein Q8K68_00960, partial [Nitrospirota bacterium]|nr:hypothetical protein [Nitrospirota bacterium]
FFTLKNIEPPTGKVAQKGDRCKLTIEYYDNKMIETHCVEIDRLDQDSLVSYAFESGVVRSILYKLEPVGEGVRLTQTFDLDTDDEAIIRGTEDELHVWLKGVGNYLKLSGSKSPLKRVQKWFMDRVWLRLTVSEKNIAMVMVKVSAVELGLLLILVLIWNIWTRI